MRKNRKAQTEALNLFIVTLILVFFFIIYLLMAFLGNPRKDVLEFEKEIDKIDENYYLLKEFIFAKPNDDNEVNFTYEYFYRYFNSQSQSEKNEILEKLKKSLEKFEEKGISCGLSVKIYPSYGEEEKEKIEINSELIEKESKEELIAKIILPFKEKSILVKFAVK